MEKMSISEYLAQILRPQDKVIVCTASKAMDETLTAIRALGAVPVERGTDLRWQSLVRLALLNRATVAVGHWRLVLGLTKLAKATAAPLRIRNVILTGEVCPDWAADAIRSGLDAEVLDRTCPDAAGEDRCAKALDPLLRWASVLDYRAEQTEMGLSLEMVVFSGKQLPQLPSGARVIVRAWDPGADEPFHRPL